MLIYFKITRRTCKFQEMSLKSSENESVPWRLQIAKEPSQCVSYPFLKLSSACMVQLVPMINRLTAFPDKQVYRLQDSTTKTDNGNGFSEAGGIYVLANILHNVVHSNIIEGRHQLILAYEEHDRNGKLLEKDRVWNDYSTAVNAFFVSAIFGLGSLLDSMATICESMFPSGQSLRAQVNFSQYGFETGKLPQLHSLKLKILACTFSELNIIQIWNKCKHEMPWLGKVSVSSSNDRADIWGADGKRLFLDFILPVYEHVQEMLANIANYKKMKIKTLSL